LPTSFVSSAGGGGTNPTQTGVANTAIPGVGVTQAVFSPSLLYASKTAPLYVKQAEQVTDSTKIELAAAVSKTFYALLLTLQQVEVLKEDTIRLTRSMSDAYHQYVGGIVDETDYQQAAITLNNSMAQLKQAVENIVPQYAALKQLIGYLPEKHFNISYDTTEMLKEVQIDTTQQLQYEKRIEYKQLITAKELQHQQTNYYRRAALPTIAALYNYNLAFGNKDYPKLFSAAYPNSYIGLSLNVPIFTGFARVHNIHRSQLQEKLLDWNQVNLRMTIYSQYTSALANYKSNLYNLALLQHNVTMAKRVYFVVDLQYKQGIVPYLNVITGESNLITSQINYLNALFQLLSSKIDLEKAMGDISY
jgi:outer membrane protein TolC